MVDVAITTGSFVSDYIEAMEQDRHRIFQSRAGFNCNMVGAADGVQNLKSHILLSFPSLKPYWCGALSQKNEETRSLIS